MYQDWGDQKDEIGITELETVIQRLQYLLLEAKKARGKSRPIISQGEIELIKDHLDLVVKYTRT